MKKDVVKQFKAELTQALFVAWLGGRLVIALADSFTKWQLCLTMHLMCKGVRWTMLMSQHHEAASGMTACHG